MILCDWAEPHNRRLELFVDQPEIAEWIKQEAADVQTYMTNPRCVNGESIAAVTVYLPNDLQVSRSLCGNCLVLFADFVRQLQESLTFPR